MPIISGVSYELIKLGAKYPNNIFFNTFLLPGLLFQQITTREPSDKQLRSAIAALKEVI